MRITFKDLKMVLAFHYYSFCHNLYSIYFVIIIILKCEIYVIKNQIIRANDGIMKLISELLHTVLIFRIKNYWICAVQKS